jgi:hypothetical protein
MPESQNIEHKSSWRDEYLRWICGFANVNGCPRKCLQAAILLVGTICLAQQRSFGRRSRLLLPPPKTVELFILFALSRRILRQ